MVLKRPPTSALSIFAIAVLISVVRVTVSATNGTATANPTTNATITVQPSTTPNITVKPSTTPNIAVLQPSTTPNITVLQPSTTPNITVQQPSTTPNITVQQPSTTPNITVLQPSTTPNITVLQPSTTPNITVQQPSTTPNITVLQPSTTPNITVLQPSTTPNITVLQPSTTPNITVLQPSTTPNITVLQPSTTPNITVLQPSTTPNITVLQPSTTPNITVLQPSTTPNITVLQPSTTPNITVLQPSTTPNITVLQPSTTPNITVLQPSTTPNITVQPSTTPNITVLQPSTTPNITVLQPSTTPNITVQPSTTPNITVLQPSTTPNITVQPSTTPNITVLQPSTTPNITVLQPSTTPNITVQPSTTPNITVLQPSTTPNITVQPSTTPNITVLQPSTTPNITVLQPSTTPNITVLQPSTTPNITVQPSTTPNITVKPSSTPNITVQPSSSLVVDLQPSINATSTVMVVQPSTYTTMMSYTTSVLTTLKITPSPSPTSKVPTVTSSLVVVIPNTKYYGYSAKFTLTNITKSGLKNQSDFEILDRLITNCQDEYTEENSIEYQKFEKYMQEEICGIFDSSSQSCSLKITSMKCGSIITKFNVTLEVNSTQSNNITNGTAFGKVEEIIKNGTLGGFVTNTSSFTSTFNGVVKKPTDVSPTSTMMTTRPTRTPTITPTPTTARKQSVVSTSSTIPKTSNKTFQYEISFTTTNINEAHVTEENFIILNLLITKCNDEYTKENSIQFTTFQRYLQKEICASVYKSSREECSVTVEELKCGSLKTQAVVELKDNSTKWIEDKIKEGSLGGLIVIKTSFSSKYIGEFTPKPTGKPPQAEPEVYVVVTMKLSWREFCAVETHFKEIIAERSYEIKGKPLTPNNIYIINRERCRDTNSDSTEGEIEVWFAVIAEEQNEATIQVGKDLIDLVDSRQTRKLGNLFEDKIVKVELGGVKAPQSSRRSDTEKIWLAVGISLGAIVLLILLYFCCCRQSEKESDAERGMTNLFLMDEMDSSKKETTELVNEGFDDQDGTHTPLSHRMSTFKDNPENGNKPITKSSSDDVSASVPADNDSMDAPLGEGEDTDDELGMTVADVAIEPESEEAKKGATPPGTLPIIPPDPTHMAIKDLSTFLEESGKENEKNKEYEDLDQTMTLPNTYPSNTLDRNRSAALVPKPETRVKLGGENDYINANFVKDHNGKNNFIATQHPLSNTMRDFWTMVWDQDVSVVVMVNEKEKDLENYHNYWLDHKNSLTIYGHMQVKTEKMEALPGYSLTKFVLQNSQESDVTKAVSHYRFTNWTENGIPNVKEFAGFIKSVEKARLENLHQPIVVHCSEGQGYTGVAIATDIGLRVYNESDKKSIINVFDCVEKMRKDRNGIVCSKDMYNFIFKVLSALTDTKESNDSKL